MISFLSHLLHTSPSNPPKVYFSSNLFTNLSQIFLLTFYSPLLQIFTDSILFTSFFMKLSQISHRSFTDLHSDIFNPPRHKFLSVPFLQDLLGTLTDFSQIFHRSFADPSQISLLKISSLIFKIFPSKTTGNYSQSYSSLTCSK